MILPPVRRGPGGIRVVIVSPWGVSALNYPSLASDHPPDRPPVNEVEQPVGADHVRSDHAHW